MLGRLFLPLALGALAWALTRGRDDDDGPGDVDDSTGMPLCQLWPQQVAERDGATIRAWLLCPGRLASQVNDVANRLAANDPEASAAVLRLWRERRRIDTSAPDGQVSPETRDRARRALDSTDEEARGPGYDPGPLPGVDGGAGRARDAPASTPPRRTGPAGYDPALARRLATGLAPHLRADGRRYNRDRVRSFQRAAGLQTDGLYGCQTRNALAHFGVSSPPAPIYGVTRDCDRHPYLPPGGSTSAGWLPRGRRRVRSRGAR